MKIEGHSLRCVCSLTNLAATNLITCVKIEGHSLRCVCVFKVYSLKFVCVSSGCVRECVFVHACVCASVRGCSRACGCAHVMMALTDVQVTICDIGVCVCVSVCLCVRLPLCVCVCAWIVRVWMVCACACSAGANRRPSDNL